MQDSGINKFWEVLFDEGQVTCFSPHSRGITVKKKPDENDVFFSINALHPHEDFEPTMNYHSPNIPRRADANVNCFRNFLIEIDTMPIEAQEGYVRSHVPISSAVYSGSKSIHFIISLEVPLSNILEYRLAARRLHELIRKADPNCKNPSRLSRIPGKIRPETGKEQKLLFIGDRIKNVEFFAKLPELQKEDTFLDRQVSSKGLNIHINHAIMHPDSALVEMNMNSRNKLFFWMYNRMNDYKIPAEKRRELIETMYNNLENKKDFTISEAFLAARIKE